MLELEWRSLATCIDLIVCCHFLQSTPPPALFSAVCSTLKENVLFGSRLDEAWYETVVDVCALTQVRPPRVLLGQQGGGSLFARIEEQGANVIVIAADDE